jgi:hypothetical protein
MQMKIPDDLNSSILCPVQVGSAIGQWPLELVIQSGEAFVVLDVKNGTPLKLKIDSALIHYAGYDVQPPYSYSGTIRVR